MEPTIILTAGGLTIGADPKDRWLHGRTRRHCNCKLGTLLRVNSFYIVSEPVQAGFPAVVDSIF